MFLFFLFELLIGVVVVVLVWFGLFIWVAVVLVCFVWVGLVWFGLVCYLKGEADSVVI